MYKIQFPETVNTVIESAKSVAFPIAELSGLVLDALDIEEVTQINNPRDYMINLIHSLVQSEEDFDILSVDLDHATAE